MAGAILYASGAITVPLQLSGQGSQLANGAAVLLGTQFFNNGLSGGPRFFGDVELVASRSGFGAAVSAQQSIDFYMVPSVDDTNFPNVDITGGVLPANSFKGSFLVTVSGNNQARMGIEAIPLMPAEYNCYIKNNTGQTLTSGWYCRMSTYQEAYT